MTIRSLGPVRYATPGTSSRTPLKRWLPLLIEKTGNIVSMQASDPPNNRIIVNPSPLLLSSVYYTSFPAASSSVRPIFALMEKSVSSALQKSASFKPFANAPAKVFRCAAKETSNSFPFCRLHQCFPVCTRLTILDCDVNGFVRTASIFIWSVTSDRRSVIPALCSSLYELFKRSRASIREFEKLSCTPSFGKRSNSSLKLLCNASIHAGFFLSRPECASSRKHRIPVWLILLREK